MISYAQNHEDVVLARAFSCQDTGFYVDVGAEHPVLNSVTKHFYDRGWRGINIEPSESCFAALEQDRPEDVNLCVGVADFEGKISFFEGPPENHGSSTFSEEVAQRYRNLGQQFTEVKDVRVTTLTAICEEYVREHTIDFLKIDVEGYEMAALVGASWDRWRPRVVVIEATVPNSPVPSHQEWEQLLLDAGYVFTLFDGVNRFYVGSESTELLEPLSRPACVLDDYIDYEHELHLEELRIQSEELQRLHGKLGRLAEIESTLSVRSEELAEARNQIRKLLRELHGTQDALSAAEEDAVRQSAATVALRERLATDHAALEREIAALHATRTFRWTASLRAAYGKLRRVLG